MEQISDQKLPQALDLLVQAHRTLALTGNEVSSPAGVPALNPSSNLWQVLDRDCFNLQNFLSGPEGRSKFWRSIGILSRPIQRAAPSAAHRALAKLFSRGRLNWVITQNIDGLHQRSGIAANRIIELYGNDLFVECLSCRKLFPREVADKQVAHGNTDPRCFLCQGILKPTIMFDGESLPEKPVLNALLAAQNCDLLLVLGAELSSPPTAYIPPLARRCGARIITISGKASPVDGMSDLVLIGDIGRVLHQICAGLFPPKQSR